MAERAKAADAVRRAAAPTSTPVPSATPIPSGVPSSLSSIPPSTASVPPSASASNTEDSTPGVSAPTSPAPARVAKAGGWRGPVVGVAIAAVGLAAAFAVAMRPGSSPAPASHHVQAAPQAAQPSEPSPAAAADAPKDAPVAPGVDSDKLPERPAAQAAAQPAAQNDAPAREAPAAAPAAAPQAAVGAPATKPATGDLASAMEKAVGPGGEGNDAAVKVDGPKSKSNGSIPEQPPQGSVQAAVRGVMGGAKSCVSGADDVTRATITFGSNGSVSGVNVTGWGASHGATGCIKAALKGAQVGAFSKPSFTVGVTIRP